MSGYYDDDDNDQQQGPKALRDALAKAQKALEDRDAKLAELEKANADLSTQVKSTSIRNAFTDAGLDPKYARFAERDEVAPDVDSVKKWVEENKDVYAFLNTAAKPAPVADADDEDDDSDEDVVDDELLAGLLAGQNLEQAGRPSGSRTIAEVLAAVDVSKFKSEQEVNDFLAKLGAPTVNG